MVSKTSLFALLCVTSLNLANLLAQDSGCTQRTIAVGVVDSAWNLVPNLSAANFRGKVQGRELQILSASLDPNPRRVVVLLDASGSMMSPDSGGWKTERSISEYLIRFAPRGASIAFLGFASTVLDTQGFNDDPAVLLKNLSALVGVCEERHKSRHTALYDAISSARGTLGVCRIGDVICALTDGEDNASRAEARKTQEELLTGQVRLFGVIMRHPLLSRAMTPEEIGPERLYSMIEATGGNKLFVPYVARMEPYNNIRAKTAADAVDLALQRLFRQMGEFYRLEVRLPEKVDKPTKWKLEVVNADGKPMKGVEVHYPQELMPCAKVSP